MLMPIDVEGRPNEADGGIEGEALKLFTPPPLLLPPTPLPCVAAAAEADWGYAEEAIARVRPDGSRAEECACCWPSGGGEKEEVLGCTEGLRMLCLPDAVASVE